MELLHVFESHFIERIVICLDGAFECELMPRLIYLRFLQLKLHFMIGSTAMARTGSMTFARFTLLEGLELLGTSPFGGMLS